MSYRRLGFYIVINVMMLLVFAYTQAKSEIIMSSVTVFNGNSIKFDSLVRNGVVTTTIVDDDDEIDFSRYRYRLFDSSLLLQELKSSNTDKANSASPITSVYTDYVDENFMLLTTKHRSLIIFYQWH